MCVSKFIHYFVNYLHTGICPLFFVSKSSFSHICSVIYRTGLSPDSGPGFQVLCQSGHATAYLTHHMKNNTFSAKVCKTRQKPCFTHQSFFIIRNDISGTLIPSQRSLTQPHYASAAGTARPSRHRFRSCHPSRLLHRKKSCFLFLTACPSAPYRIITGIRACSTNSPASYS